ncbi:Wadjet anti-phage system protein JetD domain-containing protein [Flexivirga caeni]|uniref:DUF3322 and DUF2220 domain-containing protein n=1 Tax=Flexivirga caeni TaxID=2294115 RepID=A0A3M9M6C0_9MICO|nr:DUF3322 and DUF2220 domain-containing protein [Flexivirga caeni]RNI21092.1 hypothetical protein EFY87_12500 [Flexivirga caeni]
MTARRWTTPDDIAAAVRRRWDDGSLLRADAGVMPLTAIDIPVRGPRPSQIGDDLNSVREWVAALDAGSRDGRRYTVHRQAIGGRRIGRNELPSRVQVSSLDQAWALLGVAADVGRFRELVALTATDPAVRAWVLDHPHRALELYDEMLPLLAAYRWLDEHRGEPHYLREISAPGVDTKFAERHRGVLAAMLGVPSSASGFRTALGLRAKPELVRLRPAAGLGLPAPMSELAVRATELAQLAIEPRRALVIENEITYLSVDVPQDGVVLWGKGFDVDNVGRLPWLANADVVYWGDLDTHGFAILHQLRAWLPQTRSVLMDRETLLAHRERWVREGRPTRAALTRLTGAEQDVYADLVGDAFGPKVRLEQERVDWTWARRRLAYAAPSGQWVS